MNSNLYVRITGNTEDKAMDREIPAARGVVCYTAARFGEEAHAGQLAIAGTLGAGDFASILYGIRRTLGTRQFAALALRAITGRGLRTAGKEDL